MAQTLIRNDLEQNSDILLGLRIQRVFGSIDQYCVPDGQIVIVGKAEIFAKQH